MGIFNQRINKYKLLVIGACFVIHFGFNSLGICEEKTSSDTSEEQPPDANLTYENAWILYNGKLLPRAIRQSVNSVRWRRKSKESSSELSKTPKISDIRSAVLSRRECIKLVLQHNQDIALSRMRWEVRRWNVQREHGSYEPDLVLSATREINQRRNSVQETLSQFANEFSERNNRYRVALEGLAPTGATYRLGYTLNDLNNNLVSAGSGVTEPFQNEYQTFVGVELTQPLLKNAWYKAALAPLRIAKMDERIELNDLRKQVMSVIAETESLYWDLVFVQESYKVATASVETARKVLLDNRERVKAGKMSELEIEAAEAGLASRETRQSQAKQQQKDINNRLRTLFPGAFANVNVIATDDPDKSTTETDYVKSVSMALKWNPDYLRRRMEAERQDIRLVFAKTQVWPQLDLTASYGLNGLGASVGSSWQDITNSDFKSWSIGLELRMPIFSGRRALSDYKAAQLEKQQALHVLKSLEIEIANTLDTIAVSEENARMELASALLNAKFNERLLNVELSRLDVGKSDSRMVLEIEEDLIEAKNAELESRIRYQKLLLLRELTQGTLLENRNVEILDK